MSQVNTKWEINGKAYELDLQDAETAELYEEVFEQLGKEEKTLPKDGKPSVRIRAYWQLFVNLFDRLFGEGSGIAIVGEKANVRICNEVYDDFLAFVSKQKQDSVDYQNSIVSKYSPNRAQRRAAAKK